MRVVNIIHTTQPGGVQRVGLMETAILRKYDYNTQLISILKTYEWDLFRKFNLKPIYIFNSELFGRLISGLYFKDIYIDTNIIIAHNNPCAQVAFNLKKKLMKKDENKKISIIFYLHDSLIYPIAGSIFGLALNLFPQTFKKLEYKHIQGSEIVLVNSNVTLNQIKRNHNLYECEEKMVVLYPTMNIPLPKENLCKDKDKYILIVGRFDHEAFYNVYKIFRALDYPLIIAGYGHPHNPMVKKILKLFEILKSKGKDIKIVFSPSDEQLLELYRNASLFVYPGHENFNMSAIEAMSAGCPILVADSSGVCEILPQNLREELCLNKNDTKTWINKIQEIMNDDRNYELGKECWKVTQRYNLNSHMDKLIKILKEVQNK